MSHALFLIIFPPFQLPKEHSRMPFPLNIILFSKFSPPFPPLHHFLLSSLHTLLPVTSRPSSMAPPSGADHISQHCIYGDFSSSYAERKSHRFVKWLRGLFKSGGHNGGQPGRFPQFLGDENTVWHAPDTSLDDSPNRTEEENEDLDHANALSLPEDTKKPSRSAKDLRRQNAFRRRIEDKEDPAKKF